jgi:hypothetical protein
VSAHLDYGPNLPKREIPCEVVLYGCARASTFETVTSKPLGTGGNMSISLEVVWKEGMKEVDERTLALVEDAFLDFSWCIWHEGVRAFDDGFPGTLRDIGAVRGEAIGRQAHNPHAQDLIRAASNDQLVLFIGQTRARIYAEFQLVANFRWVAYHEGQRDILRALLSQRKFNEIRALYSARQNHNPNARNLLAGVTNLDIAEMINAL